MPKITYIEQNGNSKTIEVDNGLTVMEGAVQNNISGIDADCGGGMACATCHVYVEDSWFNKIPKAEEAEQDMIDMAYKPEKNSNDKLPVMFWIHGGGNTTGTKDYYNFSKIICFEGNCCCSN